MTKPIRGPEAVLRVLYEVVFFVFALVYLPFFFMKGKHRNGLSSRFGKVPEAVLNALHNQKVVWVHGVSVGEVVQALRLVNDLRERIEGAKFLLTTTTPTGMAVAEKLKNKADAVLYFPVDFRFAVRRFIRDVAPMAVVFLETEIWPNLVWELSERGIPLFIANGRISDRAIGKYRMAKFFLSRLLDSFTAIGAQDERMKSRFLELGAREGLVSVTGNMKFDWRPQSTQGEDTQAIEIGAKEPGSFLLVAGSTHDGEEEMLFDVYESVKARCPFFSLLIAPRHLNRIPSIEKKASKKGVFLKKISEVLNRLSSNHGAHSEKKEVFLLDQMGVLAQWYRAADAVFVGGSLVRTGGHNLVEPAYFEKPVLFGPFMENFKEMAEEFKKAAAAIQVKDAEDLKKQVIEIIENKSKAVTLGRAAKKLVARHEGATEKNIEMLRSLGVLRKAAL